MKRIYRIQKIKIKPYYVYIYTLIFPNITDKFVEVRTYHKNVYVYLSNVCDVEFYTRDSCS